jgi:hypothetical protein
MLMYKSLILGSSLNSTNSAWAQIVQKYAQAW